MVGEKAADLVRGLAALAPAAPTAPARGAVAA
jgi:hypothetical protein